MITNGSSTNQLNYTPIALNPQAKELKEIQEWQGNSKSIQPQYVRKKWTLIKFKRLIRRGGFVSARLTAKTLGVDKRTIEQWLQLPVIQSALASDINYFTKNIKKSKDWKASAYLLEKAMDIQEDKDSNTDLKQLIVINT
jgi:hypothetical protein